jgi:hypothetical protein
MTPTTLELRACSRSEGGQLVAGLGLPAAPLLLDGWFAAHAVVEDEALRALLLSRVTVSTGATNPAGTLRRRHATLVHDVVLEAATRLGAVPSLEGAQVRFSPLGLPDALALPTDGWTTGGDRLTLRTLAQERIDAHLAPLDGVLG